MESESKKSKLKECGDSIEQPKEGKSEESDDECVVIGESLPAPKPKPPTVPAYQVKKKWLLQVDDTKNTVYLTLLDDQFPSKEDRSLMCQAMINKGYLKPGGKFCLIKLVGQMTDKIFDGGTVLLCSSSANPAEKLALVVKSIAKSISSETGRRSSERSSTSTRLIEQGQTAVEKQRDMLTELRSRQTATKSSNVQENLESQGPKALIRSSKTLECQYKSAQQDSSSMQGKTFSSYCFAQGKGDLEVDLFLQMVLEPSFVDSLPANWFSSKMKPDYRQIVNKSSIKYIYNIYELKTSTNGLKIERSVELCNDRTFRVAISNEECTKHFARQLGTLQDVRNLITSIANSSLCKGCEGFDVVPRCDGAVNKDEIWYSKNCSRILINTTNTTSDMNCSNCAKLRSFLQVEKYKMLRKLEERENDKLNYLSQNAPPTLEIGKSVYNLLDSFWDELDLNKVATEWKSNQAG